MIDTAQRPVPAPAKEWLSEAEVLTALGDISSTTLDRYIAAGRFPSPVIWGRDGKWNWKDVAWFWLGKEVEARLKGQPDPNETPTAPQLTSKRHQPAT